MARAQKDHPKPKSKKSIKKKFRLVQENNKVLKKLYADNKI